MQPSSPVRSSASGLSKKEISSDNIDTSILEVTLGKAISTMLDVGTRDGRSREDVFKKISTELHSKYVCGFSDQNSSSEMDETEYYSYDRMGSITPCWDIKELLSDNKSEEVDPMSDYVSKDAFEAHMRRIDDRVSSMETLLVERMGSMEERIENKIGNLTNSVDRLVASVEDQRKEIHSDNMATRISNYAVIATAVVGFIAIMVTLTR